MNNPTITTIIPTYKRPQLLRRAIRSVLNQTYKDLQVCVYDNASFDETKNVVEELALNDPRVKYFCNKTNIGAPQNFRQGIAKNKSDYFSILSDDDLLFPHFYELALENLKKYLDAAVFVGNCLIAYLNNNKIINLGFKVQKDGYYSINEAVGTFVCKHFVPWTSMLFNYSHVKSFDLTDYTINDVDYLSKIMYNHPIVVSSDVCAVFYVHNSGISSNLKITDIWPVMYEIDQNLQKYNRVDPKLKAEISLRWKSYVLQFLFQKGKDSIKIKDQKTLSESKKILLELGGKDLIKKLNFFLTLRKIPLLWQALIFARKLQLFFVKKRFFSERKQLLQLVKMSADKN